LRWPWGDELAAAEEQAALRIGPLNANGDLGERVVGRRGTGQQTLAASSARQSVCSDVRVVTQTEAA